MPINQEITAVVISPHQDDAVISLGQVLREQYAQRAVLNIFTVSDSTIADSDDSSPLSAEKVTAIRHAEEESVAADYGIDIRNGGFEDSELRGVAWDDQLARVDVRVLSQISDWLLQTLSEIDGACDVFIPAAFGLHPDHYLTLLAFTAETLLAHVKQHANAIYLYGEQPYLLQQTGFHQGHRLLETFSPQQHQIDPNTKRQMLSHYPSQLSPERVENLLALPFESYWQVTPAELEAFLQASLHRETAGTFAGFGAEDWLQRVEQNYQSQSREFINITVAAVNGENCTVSMVIEAFDVPEAGVCKLARFAGVYVSDYFSAASQIDGAAFEDLKQQLAAAGADGIWLSCIRTDDEFFRVVSSGNGEIVPNIPTVGLFCDHSFNQWLAKQSKNMRRNVKRKFEKLETYAREAGQPVVFSVKPASAASLDVLLANQEARAEVKDFEVFGTNPEYAGFIRSLKEVPNAHIGELRVGDSVVASLLFFTDEANKTIAFYMQSFDELWGGYSPSFCAIVKLIEYAHEQGFLYVDFLRGDEEYKRHFTNNTFGMVKYIELLNAGVSQKILTGYISHYEE